MNVQQKGRADRVTCASTLRVDTGAPVPEDSKWRWGRGNVSILMSVPGSRKYAHRNVSTTLAVTVVLATKVTLLLILNPSGVKRRSQQLQLQYRPSLSSSSYQTLHRMHRPLEAAEEAEGLHYPNAPRGCSVNVSSRIRLISSLIAA